MEFSKDKLAEAPACFTPVDNVRAPVTMGELEWKKEVDEFFLSNLEKDHTDACVIMGESVLTLRFEGGGRCKQYTALHTSHTRKSLFARG